MKKDGKAPTFLSLIDPSIFDSAPTSSHHSKATLKQLNSRQVAQGAPPDIPPRLRRRPRKNEIVTADVLAMLSEESDAWEERYQSEPQANEEKTSAPKRKCRKTGAEKGKEKVSSTNTKGHLAKKATAVEHNSVPQPRPIVLRTSKRFVPASPDSKRHRKPSQRFINEEKILAGPIAKKRHLGT